MTYRFDLAHSVAPDALKAAWEKTLTVYPYMGYAVVPRDKRLLLTELFHVILGKPWNTRKRGISIL